MSAAAELFNQALFLSLLSTTAVGRHVEYLSAGCSSTMDVAASLSSPQHGTLVLAESQTAGRGRVEGRRWQSAAEGNLYFTLVVRPSSIAQLRSSNLSAAVAVTAACREMGVPHAAAKWPNDVWIGRRKAAGMIVDSAVTGGDILARVGIGINVNQRVFPQPEGDQLQPADSAAPTSLASELGRDVSREHLLASFCNRFEPLFLDDPRHVLAAYRTLEFLHKESQVTVMPKKREDPLRVIATPLGISDDGLFVVRYPDGSRHELIAEEITVRPSS